VNTAYAIGYRNGYDAGRAAAVKELQSQNARAIPDAGLANRPSIPAQSSDSSAPSPQPATASVTSRVQKTPPAAQQSAMAEEDDAREPSDADPAIDPSNASKPAQYKPETLHKQNALSRSAVDNEPAFDFASLELPSAGTRISLRGSLESLQRQNSKLEAEGLERILDDDDLNSRIAHGLLTPLPASAYLTVNPGLPENRRYCRSWTARFLKDLAKAHGAAFRHPLQVNSAVRTVDYQKRLIRVNGNAAAAEGDLVSPHLTGATIDIGKQGMTRAELLWMRRHLFALQSAGKIDVEEEFAQACFHITVYKTYTTAPPVRRPAPPAMREAAAPEKPAAPRRRSSLPSSIAAGTFTAQ
jgi:hypothetical protein